MDTVGRYAVGIVVVIAIVMLLLYARGVPDHGPVVPAIVVTERLA